GDDPLRVRAAVDSLAEEDVVAILGPLASNLSAEAAKAAEARQIPIVVLSQQPGIPEMGAYVFRNTITPEAQVHALVDYLVVKRGLRRFFVLHPDNTSGEEFKRLFTEAMESRGRASACPCGSGRRPGREPAARRPAPPASSSRRSGCSCSSA
ncbi:MAG: ABC transporter substrate-binding protein, partial [Candidatus Rokubacteria bacterium]|nr:ABC transporter substrate-binding protein [Candidatus Rokubacteria bacterium]